MKRITIKLFFALFTFCIGITGVFLWWKTPPPTVTLCQLAQNPDLYRYQNIKVEVDAVGGLGIVAVDDTCPTPASAGVWLDEDYKPSADVQSFYNESETELYKARILVTGRFDPEATRGCFTPAAAIRATNIELKSAITAEAREKFEEVSASTQELAAREFFADFQKAVAKNDRKKVASMMQFPLRVNFYTDPRARDYRFIESRSDFLEAYEQIFSYSVKDYIVNFNPNKVWGNDYFMQTDSGQIGISVSCKDNKDSCNYDLKVKIIHSNSIEIGYKTSLCGDTIDCYIKADNEQNKNQQK